MAVVTGPDLDLEQFIADTEAFLDENAGERIAPPAYLAAASVKPPRKVRDRVTFVVQNVEGPDGPTKRRRTIRVTAATQADVLGFCELEAGDLAHTLGDDNDGKRYDWVQFRECGIAWDAGHWTLVRVDRLIVHTGVEGVTPTRVILTVTLRSKLTGLEWAFTVTHVVHHIDVGGRPRVDVGKYVGQTGRARRHFRMLRNHLRTVERRRRVAALMGGMDGNVDFEDDRRRGPSWFPYRMLSKVVRLAVPAGPTAEGRTIDWTWLGGRARFVSCVRIRRTDSDHRGVATRALGPWVERPAA